MSRSVPDVVVRDIAPGDVDELIFSLRETDRQEILAYSDDIPMIVNMSIAHSKWAKVVTVDGKIACIFGLGQPSLLSDMGMPWLLGTPVMNKHRRSVIAYGKYYIPKMLEEFPHLWNIVHVDNKRSIRWLKSLGFTISDPMPRGPKKGMFHAFEMRA